MRWLTRAGGTLLSPWMAGLAALLVGYMLFYRLSLPDHGSGFGAGEVIALFASDPYYSLYVVVPAWLLAAVLTIRWESEPQVLIRDGSRRRWLTRVLVGPTTARLAAAGLVLAVVWVLAGVGFAPTAGWVMFVQHPDSTFFGAALGPSGLTPPGLIAAEALTLALAAIASAATIATVYLLTGRTGAAATVAVVMFVAPIIGHVLAFLPIGPLALLSLENYVSPLAAQTSLGAWWAGAAVSAVWIVVLYVVVAVIDRRQAAVQLTLRLGYVGYAVAASLLIIGAVSTFPQAHQDLLHSLVFTFQGASQGGSALLPYLVASVVFLAPAYFVAATLESRLGGLIYYELIRYGSYRHWFAWQLAQSFLIAVIVLGGSALAAIAAWAAVTAGRGHAGADQLILDPGLVGYLFFVNGLLQLVFYAALSILLIWLTGRTTTALAGLGVIFVTGFFPLGPWPILPIYLNSLSYTTAGWPAALAGTGILLASTAIVLIVLALHTRTRGLTV